MKNHGPAVYLDISTRDTRGKKRHNVWRADITINGKRYRKRGKSESELRQWLESMQAHNREEAK
jgi:hypothetical protein